MSKSSELAATFDVDLSHRGKYGFTIEDLNSMLSSNTSNSISIDYLVVPSKSLIVSNKDGWLYASDDNNSQSRYHNIPTPMQILNRLRKKPFLNVFKLSLVKI
jgi:hypothetical protein